MHQPGSSILRLVKKRRALRSRSSSTAPRLVLSLIAWLHHYIARFHHYSVAEDLESIAGPITYSDASFSASGSRSPPCAAEFTQPKSVN